METRFLPRTYLKRSAPDLGEVVRRRWMFRHPAVIRVTHWINALCLLVLLMSGLQIFNAHPALYWGKASTFDTPLLAMSSTVDDPPKGTATVLGRTFDTTGYLGSSPGTDGEPADRGFPSWLTLPSDQDLTGGRSWHFFFAWAFVLNGVLYLLYGLLSGQLRFRVVPQRDQVRHFGASVWEHLTLRFPQGDEAKRYNVIQKLTYAAVLFVLLPVQVLAGLAMSPAMDAAFPFLLTLFDGRQSARTVHFVVAGLLVLFVVVHVAFVVLSGFWNNMRGMLTGWFVIERKVESVSDPENVGGMP
ncbi:cytochrome b/b6 domain-containing protein [Methylobacterium sp. NMS14P]|uniref:cytochrome b/b6 domain-containing protein n=1 Tax=Methylobacterium sp. NMS14P TaxID=2894310 RepID=UPI002359287C|nr:cytochrome b/b6 domain-containing protein [Methylobacterium sp. NMS14P]WCS28286.1 cytochrome b/b6 domain-containing protein [Methylobacterium sp. NMS14P]